MKLERSIISILITLIVSIFNAKSQNIWETFGTSSSPWVISSELKSEVNNSSKVIIENQNYPTEENKRNNTWSYNTAWISLTSYNESPIDISFSVRNIIPTSLYNRYNSESTWYWVVKIDYTTTAGTDKYFKLLYFTSKYSSSNNTYQQFHTDDNGVSTSWLDVTSMDNRRFRILFEDNTIKIYNDRGDNLAKTIYGVKKLRFIQVGPGQGTKLEITNTSCQKMTTYGQALPYLTKAVEYMDKNRFSAAASEMTTAINKGLKCYETYLMRGLAYYYQDYYKTAIEDFTSAINCTASNKESAYYYRGMSKLELGDDYGVNDLRNGGQEGMVFLRENNLLNYTPGQSKKRQTTKSNNSPSGSKKPALSK